ncbi:MAG: transposase [Burkholderiales bacterium]|nr:transposase [Anaerolineae bacterium]
MTTRILIINRHLAFAVTLKQALEKTGIYEVFPFTEVDAGLDFLRESPQDVALVDFGLPDVLGIELVRQLRDVQPNLAIIVSPRQSDTAILNGLRLQAMIDTPITARTLIPIIQSALEQVRQTQWPEADDFKASPQSSREDETSAAPPRRFNLYPGDLNMQQPGSVPEFSSLDNVLSQFGESNFFDSPSPDDGDTPVTPQETAADDPSPFRVIGGQATSGQEFEDVLTALGDEGEGGSDNTPFKQADRSGFNELVDSMRGDQPHTSLPDRHRQLIEFILADASSGEGPTEGERRRPGEDLLESLLESTTFRRLAEEEPPMPLFEESGTVGDLMLGVADSGFQNVLSIMRDESREDRGDSDSTASRPLNLENADTTPGADINATADAIPAQFILEATMDTSTPIEVALDEIRASMERGELLPPDADLYVREPDFLREPGVPDFGNTTIDLIGQTTRPSQSQEEQLEQDIQEARDSTTEQLLPSQQTRPAPPVTLPEQSPPKPKMPTPPKTPPVPAAPPVPAVPATDAWDEAAWAWDASADTDQRAESIEAVEEAWPISSANPSDTPIINVPVPTEDSELAKMALSLTQVSLELTAEASLLSRDGEVIAVAGHLSSTDLESLLNAIANDWDAETGAARIRFITLPSSGKEYMLYSRRTDSEYTLSMIFAGTMPLRAIRRQGDRLLDALDAVPDAPPIIEESQEILRPLESTAVSEAPAPEITQPAPALDQTAPRDVSPPARASQEMVITPTPATPEVGPLTAYAYVWLLRDREGRLSERAAEAIHAGLNVQLAEQHWQIRVLEVQEDYVYLVTDVPGETPPPELIRDLKRRSADIARTQDSTIEPSNLWADSYLVITPGRELDLEEIQQFINFERML